MMNACNKNRSEISPGIFNKECLPVLFSVKYCNRKMVFVKINVIEKLNGCLSLRNRRIRTGRKLQDKTYSGAQVQCSEMRKSYHADPSE